MPVLFPTPDELHQAPWRVEQAARDRLNAYKKELRLISNYMNELVDAQFQARQERLEQEIAQANDAVAKAHEILQQLKADHPAVIAERRRVVLEAIYGRSA